MLLRLLFFFLPPAACRWLFCIIYTKLSGPAWPGPHPWPDQKFQGLYSVPQQTPYRYATQRSRILAFGLGSFKSFKLPSTLPPVTPHPPSYDKAFLLVTSIPSLVLLIPSILTSSPRVPLHFLGLSALASAAVVVRNLEIFAGQAEWTLLSATPHGTLHQLSSTFLASLSLHHNG